jgi:hypothetical protein
MAPAGDERKSFAGRRGAQKGEPKGGRRADFSGSCQFVDVVVVVVVVSGDSDGEVTGALPVAVQVQVNGHVHDYIYVHVHDPRLVFPSSPAIVGRMRVGRGPQPATPARSRPA